MIGTTVTFKNVPQSNGSLANITINECLVSNTGTPQATRPQIMIHLPKADSSVVDGGFVDYEGESYHVVGTTAKQMDANTPTKWNRYAIAERIKAL